MKRVAAIHQPTFLPWLGWWDKLVRADVFVLLDDVQFPKKGGTWINRVRLLDKGEPLWATVPVERSYHGVRTVREVRIDGAKPWRERIYATIERAYGSARHADDVLPIVREVLRMPTDRIAELNEAAIRLLARRLTLDVSKVVHQSELGVTGTGTELLVALCHAAGADAYLSGDGAGGYLDEDRFTAGDVELVYQRFTPPTYPQLGVAKHVAGLSLIDAAMNCGWEQARTLLVS